MYQELNQTEIRLSDALVLTLRDFGVDTIFGVSGANIEHIHDSIHRLGGTRIRSILSKSEVGAAFMADGRARSHKTLGVCCATTGGAMMNLAVGVAESYSQGVPLLALVGQIPKSQQGIGGFQDSSGVNGTINAVSLWSSISKFTARIDDPIDFWDILKEALQSIFSGKYGPSVLLLPRDVMEKVVPERPEDFPSSLTELIQSKKTSNSLLHQFYTLLETARHPVLILGFDLIFSPNADAVVQFAEHSGIAVASTISSISIYPNSRNNYLGVAGIIGNPSANNFINHTADLIIGVGTQFDYMSRIGIETGLTTKNVVIINQECNKIDPCINTFLRIKDDPGLFFEKLGKLVINNPVHFSSVSQMQRTFYIPELPEEERAESLHNPLLRSEALNVIQHHLPENGYLFLDAGNCAAAAAHYLTIPENTESHIALGMGGMGYAIAAAIGAQVNKKKPCVVICGDGAFLMMGMEVHTTIEYGLPVLFLVFNNSSHGMCVTRQQKLFQGREECVRYNEVDFSLLGQGLANGNRFWSARADSVAELDQQLQVYYSMSPQPGLLDIRLPVEEIPPFVPFLLHNSEIEFKNKLELSLAE